MSMTGPDDEITERHEDQVQRTAEHGGDLAEAVQGKITGEGLEDDEDSADGEQASD